MPTLRRRYGLAALLAAAVPLAAQSVNVIEKTLSNGMRLLMVERHDQPTIAAGWITKFGSANERVGVTGVAHLFEHMMFKGTSVIGTKNPARDKELNDLQDKLREEIRKEESILRRKQLRGEIEDMNDPKVRSERHQKLVEDFEKLVKEQQELLVKDEFSKIYTENGATGLNAFTNSDVTCYINTIPSNKLELWAWMESSRLMDPVFREFYKERDVVYEERRLRTESTPTGRFQEQINAMVWQASPYNWQTIGWPSDVANITRAQAFEFFGTYYAPNNLTAVLVGDFNPKEAEALVERYFGRLKANPAGVPEMVTLEPPQLAEQRVNAEAETTPSLNITYKTVADGHRDDAALELLSDLLSGRTGRLTKELVNKQKVATNAFAFSGTRKYGGTFVVGATLAPEKKHDEVEQALYREIEKLQKELVPAAELRKVKNQAQADSYRRLESDMFLMIQLASADATTGYQEFLDNPKKLEAVTAEDIQRVAKKYFTKENRTVASYSRKGGPAAPEDPEIAALPEQVRPMVKASLERLGKETDAEKLRKALEQMRGQADAAPAQFKPALELMIKRVEARLKQLEAK
jgi:predicted Zn-dependent peptidase